MPCPLAASAHALSRPSRCSTTTTTLAAPAGQKLYELAREGQQVELEARPVSVPRYDVWREQPGSQTVHFNVTCSKGTYIRWGHQAAAGCCGCCRSICGAGPSAWLRACAWAGTAACVALQAQR